MLRHYINGQMPYSIGYVHLYERYTSRLICLHLGDQDLDKNILSPSNICFFPLWPGSNSDSDSNSENVTIDVKM